MEKLILGIAYLLTISRWLLGAFIYIWTLIIAYHSAGGILSPIISAFLPFLSQVYWGFKAWQVSGFDSPYIQWLIVLVVLFFIQYTLTFLVSLYEQKQLNR